MYANLNSPTHTSDVHQRLFHAREFIDTCYHLPLDLDQISRQAFFSPYHFLRLFKQTFCKTPHVVDKLGGSPVRPDFRD